MAIDFVSPVSAVSAVWQIVRKQNFSSPFLGAYPSFFYFSINKKISETAETGETNPVIMGLYRCPSGVSAKGHLRQIQRRWVFRAHPTCNR